MRLASIHLENYRCHANLKVDFAKGFNVIVGVNGIGKTALLNGICDSLSGLTVGMNAHQIQPLSAPGIPRLLTVNSGGRFRFEPQYPVKVRATGDAFDAECVWAWTKTSQLGNAKLSGQSPGKIWESRQRGRGDPAVTAATSVDLPVIAFYRANRLWNQPQPLELQAATERNSRLDGYANWWDGSSDSVALQRWAIAKTLERYQTSSEAKASFDAIKDDELALVNAALSAAIDDVRGLRYDLNQKCLLVEWQTAGDMRRDPTSFENLSDGQRAVIGLVADIARRMCLLNPQLGREVTSKTSGVVLIDELETHLHPKWQRIVTIGLKTAFPALQFIVASHSPQILGELTPEEIIVLREGGTSHPQVSYGLDSGQVLEEIMDATARSPEVEKALSELFAALERNEIVVAKEQLRALADAAPGIAELTGAQALLARKEVLGR
jgi:predicted ATP-binding protein involved in virulence